MTIVFTWVGQPVPNGISLHKMVEETQAAKIPSPSYEWGVDMKMNISSSACKCYFFIFCLNQIQRSAAFFGRVLAICDHLWQSLDRRCLHYHVSLLHFLVQIPSVTTIETLLGTSSGASGVFQLVTCVLCEIVGYSCAAAIRFTHIGIL